MKPQMIKDIEKTANMRGLKGPPRFVTPDDGRLLVVIEVKNKQPITLSVLPEDWRRPE